MSQGKSQGIPWWSQDSKKALALLSISDHIYTGEALSAEERQNGFRAMMEVALKTAVTADV